VDFWRFLEALCEICGRIQTKGGKKTAFSPIFHTFHKPVKKPVETVKNPSVLPFFAAF